MSERKDVPIDSTALGMEGGSRGPWRLQRQRSLISRTGEPNGPQRLVFSVALCGTSLAILLLSISAGSVAAQTNLPRVTIHQVRDVFQGQLGEFAIEIVPSNTVMPVILRLK